MLSWPLIGWYPIIVEGIQGHLPIESMRDKARSLLTRIQLPEFSGANCTGFTACAELKKGDFGGIKPRRPFTYSYGSGKSKGMIHAFFAVKQDAGHLHVDAWNPSRHLNSNEDASRTVTAAGFEKFFSQFFGKQVKLSVTAYYEVNKSVVHPAGPMKLLSPMSPTQSSEMSIRPTGLEIVHTGGGSKWVLNLFDEDEMFFVKFDTSYKATINDKYLNTTQQFIETVFTEIFCKPPVIKNATDSQGQN